VNVTGRTHLWGETPISMASVDSPQGSRESLIDAALKAHFGEVPVKKGRTNC
jgi:hypothetical protein